MRRSPVVCRWTLLAGLLALAPDLSWAAAPADADAVRRQTAEVERLQQELRRAQAELDRLQESSDATALKAPPVAAPTNPAIQAVPAATPGAPSDLAALPPLQANDVVPVADLLRHYQQDPAAADARYRGKTLSVRGEIAGFDRPLARRVYELLFEAPDRSLDLVCQFGYIDEYRTVFTEDSGRVLVGRTEGLATRTLFHRGETVTVRGRCQGLRKGVVRLTQCSRVE